MAERFAAEGAKVVLMGRNEDRGRDAEKAILAEGGEALFVRTEISNETDARNAVAATIEGFGKLTILVNNAGGTERVASADKIDDFVADVAVENWNKILGTDLTGTRDEL